MEGMKTGTQNTRFAIDSFGLKLVAIIAMSCNHVSNVFGSLISPDVNFILYSLGGMTFPVMAYMLVEGYTHTSNLRNYALRLLGFALISQIPFSLLWGSTPNVLFTLLAGLGVLWITDTLKSRFAAVGILVIGIIASSSFDWGGLGILVIYCFKQWRHDRRGIAKTTGILVLVILVSVLMGYAEEFVNQLPTGQLTAAFASQDVGFSLTEDALPVSMLNEMGYGIIGCGCAGALLCRYSGKRGKPLKWLFYAYYPSHLLAIWLVANGLGLV